MKLSSLSKEERRLDAKANLELPNLSNQRSLHDRAFPINATKKKKVWEI